MVPFGADANDAKVFRSHAASQGLCDSLIIAHAAPLGLCDNLINASELLANQQKDGDSPIQSIVIGLHERSRKGIMDGLRSFIELVNHSAVDVSHLRKGIRSFKVQKPNFSEDYPMAAIWEGAEELTLRGEEVGTLKACINIDHIEDNR